MLHPHTLYVNKDNEPLLIIDEAVETLPIVELSNAPEVMLYRCMTTDGVVLATQGTIEERYTKSDVPVAIQKQFTVSMTSAVPEDQIEQMIAQVQAACIHITASSCVPFELTEETNNVKDALTLLGEKNNVGYWCYGTVENITRDDQFINIEIVLAGFVFPEKLNAFLSKRSAEFKVTDDMDYALILDRMITRFHNPMNTQLTFGRFLDFDVTYPSDDALATNTKASDPTEAEIDPFEFMDFDGAERAVEANVKEADAAAADIAADNDCGDACKI